MDAAVPEKARNKRHLRATVEDEDSEHDYPADEESQDEHPSTDSEYKKTITVRIF